MNGRQQQESNTIAKVTNDFLVNFLNLTNPSENLWLLLLLQYTF